MSCTQGTSPACCYQASMHKVQSGSPGWNLVNSIQRAIANSHSATKSHQQGWQNNMMVPANQVAVTRAEYLTGRNSSPPTPIPQHGPGTVTILRKLRPRDIKFLESIWPGKHSQGPEHLAPSAMSDQQPGYCCCLLLGSFSSGSGHCHCLTPGPIPQSDLLSPIFQGLPD